MQAAVNGASTSLSLRLSQFGTQTGTLQIPEGSKANITIDLNGNTLDGGKGNAIEHRGSGILTITDSGSAGAVRTTAEQAKAILNASNGTINITGGYIISSGFGTCSIFNESTGTVKISGGLFIANGSYTCIINNRSTGAVHISGGTFDISGDDSYVLINLGSKEVYISGGSLSASGPLAKTIYNDYQGVINISGGSLNVEGERTTVIYNTKSPNVGSNAGSIIMTGGEVTAQGDNSIGIFTSHNGVVQLLGGKVSAYGDTTYGIYSYFGSIFFNKGSIYANGNTAYGIYSEYYGPVQLVGTVEVKAEGKYSYGISSANTYVDGNAKIQGGLVAQTHAAAIRSYSEYDYEYVYGSSNFEGGKDSYVSYNRNDIATYKCILYSLRNRPVCKVGLTTFASLEEAFPYANRVGGTIELLDSTYVTKPIKITSGNFTIDLRGFIIHDIHPFNKNSKSAIFELYKNATLTITDSSYEQNGKVTSYENVTIMLCDNANLLLNRCEIRNFGPRGRTIFNIGNGGVKLIDADVGSLNDTAIDSKKISISGTCLVSAGIRTMSSMPEFIGYTDGMLVTAINGKWGIYSKLRYEYAKDILSYKYLEFQPDTEN